jgi:hypothetical protein
MVDKCSGIIGAGCVLSAAKTSNTKRLSFVINFRTPPFIFFNPVDTLVATSVVLSYASVVRVLEVATFAEIFFSVVQSVVITMVNFLAILTACYNMVHPNKNPKTTTRNLPHGAKGFGHRIPMSTPVPLREPLEILGVNDSILATRERNISERLVKRLGNRLPLDFDGARVDSTGHIGLYFSTGIFPLKMSVPCPISWT